MKKRTALFALLLAAGPVLAGEAMPTKEASRIAVAAKNNLSRKLKDPASAQYRGLFISARDVESEGGKTVAVHYLCGEVNARNSLGGYVGFRRFVASPVVGAFIDDPDDGSAAAAFEEVAWGQSCVRRVRAYP